MSLHCMLSSNLGVHVGMTVDVFGERGEIAHVLRPLACLVEAEVITMHVQEHVMLKQR